MNTWREGALAGLAVQQHGGTVASAALLTWNKKDGQGGSVWEVSPSRPASAVLESVVDGLAKAVRSRTPIVGHNVPQTLTALDYDCRAHGVATLSHRLGGDGEIRPLVDTWVLGGHLRPDLPRHSLEALTDAYGAQAAGLGTAEGQARAVMRLAWTIYGKHKEVQIDARTLHAYQARWYLPVLTRCAAHEGRQSWIDPTLRWPLRPYVEPEPEAKGFQLALPFTPEPEEAEALAALIGAGFRPTLLGTTERI